MVGRHSGTATLLEAAATALFWAAVVVYSYLVIGAGTELAKIQWLQNHWVFVVEIFFFFDLPPLIVAFAAGERDFKVDRYLQIGTLVLLAFCSYLFSQNAVSREAWAVMYACWGALVIDLMILYIIWYVRRMFRRREDQNVALQAELTAANARIERLEADLANARNRGQGGGGGPRPQPPAPVIQPVP